MYVRKKERVISCVYIYISCYYSIVTKIEFVKCIQDPFIIKLYKNIYNRLNTNFMLSNAKVKFHSIDYRSSETFKYSRENFVFLFCFLIGDKWQPYCFPFMIIFGRFFHRGGNSCCFMPMDIQLPPF